MEGSMMTAQGYITNQLSETVPVGNAVLGTVVKGVVTVVNTGEARWFLAFDKDGLICAKRIFPPQKVLAGTEEGLNFQDPFII